MSVIFRIPTLIILICIGCRSDQPVEIRLSPEKIAAFLDRHQTFDIYGNDLKTFYEKRNYQPAWFNETNENSTHAFIDFMNEVEKDSLYVPAIYTNDLIRHQTSNDTNQLVVFELALSGLFFDYAAHHITGLKREVMKKSGWNIYVKKIEPAYLLDSLLNNSIRSFDKLESQNEQFQKLKSALQLYVDLNKRDTLQDLSSIKQADPNWFHLLRHKLLLNGDLKKNSGVAAFDKELSDAIKQFQMRHGLEQNGKINDETIAALNTPVKKRIEKIRLNMFRCLAMPDHFPGDNIVVNIPEYVLHVYHNDEHKWSCNVVVGSDSTNTVVFNDSIEKIVFSPSWSLPMSIIIKETIPAVLEDDDYLVNHNMEVFLKDGSVVDPDDVDWDDYEEGFPYDIVQRPGPGNALGRVKFLLPNKHSIYLHDTPSKSLFKEPERAFSHGCIRISEPAKLAQYLLRDKEAWTNDSISSAMNTNEELFVKLDKSIPVYLTYFTSWVDENGNIHFRDDIYEHDKKLKSFLKTEKTIAYIHR